MTKVLAVVGWVVAVLVLILVGWSARDVPAPVDLRQAAPLAAVFAAVPTGIWIRPNTSRYLIAAGGGWFIASVATMFGGNTLMWLGIVYGFVVLMTGARRQSKLSVALAGFIILFAILLVAAVFAAFDPGLLTGVGAVLLATLVAVSATFFPSETDQLTRADG